MKVGNVNLDFLGHDGFLITNGKRIVIDPYHVSPHVKPVDIVLLTHDHHDHCSVQDIERLVKQGTLVIGPPHVQSAVMKIKGIEVHPIEVGDKLEIEDVKIEVVPAYNVNKYRDDVKKIVFHPKSESYVGYVVKLGNVIIYHTGDTDFIPEMQKLSGYSKKDNTFIALLPVSGTYVMDAEEAAEAADVLHPDVAIPMHYGAGVVGSVEDAYRFVELCKERNIHAQVLDKL